MNKHRFLTLFALNIAIVLLAPPWSWAAAICTLLLAPVAMGICVAHFFGQKPATGQWLRLLAIIGAGALLRAYWGAVTTTHDFTFDHEPEIEFFLAFCQLAVGSSALLVANAARKAVTLREESRQLHHR